MPDMPASNGALTTRKDQHRLRHQAVSCTQLQTGKQSGDESSQSLSEPTAPGSDAMFFQLRHFDPRTDIVLLEDGDEI
jgi:hypothetical protein